MSTPSTATSSPTAATSNPTAIPPKSRSWSYTYSVTAVSTSGQQSIPAFATVEITILGIDSLENELRVFPNPIRNYLNISLEQPFRYTIFNSIGQLVREGASAGDAQIVIDKTCSDIKQKLRTY